MGSRAGGRFSALAPDSANYRSNAGFNAQTTSRYVSHTPKPAHERKKERGRKGEPSQLDAGCRMERVNIILFPFAAASAWSRGRRLAKSISGLIQLLCSYKRGKVKLIGNRTCQSCVSLDLTSGRLGSRTHWTPFSRPQGIKSNLHSAQHEPTMRAPVSPCKGLSSTPHHRTQLCSQRAQLPPYSLNFPSPPRDSVLPISGSPLTPCRQPALPLPHQTSPSIEPAALAAGPGGGHRSALVAAGPGWGGRCCFSLTSLRPQFENIML